MMKSHARRYPALLIATHWLTLALLVAVYAAINLGDAFPKGSDARALMKHWHYMLGLAVFGLVLVRLPLRLALHSPPITPPLPAWQQVLASAMHAALYALLIALPLLGWLTLSAKGEPIPFFGLELPALIGASPALAGSLKDIHETIGTLGYWLIGLHAAAALAHHYLARDDTLHRMWPWAAARQRVSRASRQPRLR
jgi:cytochrome b561